MNRRAAAARTGQFSPLIAGLSIGLAIVTTPSFSVTGDALSDLGVASAPTAPIFNGGLILAGFVSLPFCWYVIVSRRHPSEAIGGLLLAAATAALAGVGLFPSGTPLHLPAAIVFYLLSTYGIAAVATGEVLAGSWMTGLIGIWAAIAILSTWLLWAIAVVFGFPDGLAIPEAIGAVIIGSWFVWTAQRASGDAT